MIIQVKGNQKTLLHQCRSISQEYNPKDTHRSYGKAHGRQESRTVRTFSIPDHKQPWFRSRGWKDVAMVICVGRMRSVFDTHAKCWRRSTEESHYISTIPLSAQQCATGIRQHWGIENSNHHVRDVTLGEDASRIRRNPEILAKLRSIALNLLRASGAQNIRQSRFAFGLNIATLLEHRSLIF